MSKPRPVAELGKTLVVQFNQNPPFDWIATVRQIILGKYTFGIVVGATTAVKKCGNSDDEQGSPVTLEARYQS